MVRRPSPNEVAAIKLNLNVKIKCATKIALNALVDDCVDTVAGGINVERSTIFRLA